MTYCAALQKASSLASFRAYALVRLGRVDSVVSCGLLCPPGLANDCLAGAGGKGPRTDDRERRFGIATSAMETSAVELWLCFKLAVGRRVFDYCLLLIGNSCGAATPVLRTALALTRLAWVEV